MPQSESETVTVVPLFKDSATSIAEEYDDAWAAPNPDVDDGEADIEYGLLVLDGDSADEVMAEYAFVTEEKERGRLEAY